MICFTVYGTPVPQGSMRAFIPKGASCPVITGDNTKTKPWRQEVALMAMEAMRDSFLRGTRSGMIKRPRAVRVECDFYFARPKSVSKKTRLKTTKPDSDKLLRSIFDSLTGICYEDDGQVAQWAGGKYFDVQPRAEIRVTAIEQGAR